MIRTELTAAEAAQLINAIAEALNLPPDAHPHQLPEFARGISLSLIEQNSKVAQLEPLTTGLRETCKLASEANRELIETNRSLLAQLNAIRSDVTAGPFLIVTDWTTVATFDEACRRAGQVVSNKLNRDSLAIVARPAALCRTTHTTDTDPAAIAEWFAE
ncbi:hypothetical protein GCM10007933_02650 [Zoogloea oryzae]|uniref:Uncharacterized protein n=1 Tax=Zoogloea oryzae TaxID=310767 RepID=A0ABQ6F5J7_9RHOO|nr:hypothetical protein [Zoogloea oryzae]GLT20813.1 hypothetical protein GCM10007933_02650 [Zoogloea oryzae]